MKYSFYFWFFITAIAVLAGCSPKIVPTKKPQVPVDTSVIEQPKKVDIKKEPVKRRFTDANISLLVPFDLDKIDLKTATKEEVEKYAMPIDFYQGFKLGIDSAATFGLNFKLNVFDTEDSLSQISTFFDNNRFMSSNLVVGPVFPKGIKAVSEYSIAHHITIVSPLAASNPTDFNNPNLVSIANNLDQHALKIATYIAQHFDPKNSIVVIINTKKTDDESFAAPIRSFFKKTSSQSFFLQEYPSTYALERNMVKGKRYAIVLASDDKAFVSPTITKLFKLKNNPKALYDISLFGHPSWIKQNYPVDQLENLNTIITTSYKIDYKSTNVTKFIKTYRYRYGFEPGEYAFKGFDIGFYFGRLLAKYGEDYRDFITKEPYRGLHNNFSFVHDDRIGFINTSLMLLRYRNFSLNVVN